MHSLITFENLVLFDFIIRRESAFQTSQRMELFPVFLGKYSLDLTTSAERDVHWVIKISFTKFQTAI